MPADWTPLIDTAGAQGASLGFTASTAVTQDLAKDRFYSELDVVDTIVYANDSVGGGIYDDPMPKAGSTLYIQGSGAKPFVAIDDLRTLYYDNLLEYEGSNMADADVTTTASNSYTVRQPYRLHFGENSRQDLVADPLQLHSGNFDLSAGFDGADYNVLQIKRSWPATTVMGAHQTITAASSGCVTTQEGLQGLHGRRYPMGPAWATPEFPNGGGPWRTATPYWWSEKWAPGATFSNLSYNIDITPGAWIREALLLFTDNGTPSNDNRTDAYVTELALKLPMEGQTTPMYLPIHQAKSRVAMNHRLTITTGATGTRAVGRVVGVVKVDFRGLTSDRRGLNMYQDRNGNGIQKGTVSWRMTVATSGGNVFILYKGWFPPANIQPGNSIWNQPIPG